MTIPRILFVSCMPLTKAKAASMVFMSVLLERYCNKFVWFSLHASTEDFENHFNIPYDYFGNLKYLTRFPTLRLLLNYLLWTWVMAYQATKFGRLQKCEVVLADLAFEAVITGRITAKMLRVPLFVNIHDDPINRIRLKGYPYCFVAWYEKQFAKTLQVAKKVAVISEYMAEIYRYRYGIDAKVLYIGVENKDALTVNKHKRISCPITIGSIGSINFADNWATLVRAVQLLNQKHGKGKFQIIHIGSITKSIEMSQDVITTGWISDREYNHNLELIDACFLNSSFQRDLLETGRLSFPLKIHSYIQAQKPMIAFGPPDSSVVRFVNDYKCGITCTEANCQALARSIETLVSDETLYNEAVYQVQGLKNTFSREQFFLDFETFIQI